MKITALALRIDPPPSVYITTYFIATIQLFVPGIHALATQPRVSTDVWMRTRAKSLFRRAARRCRSDYSTVHKYFGEWFSLAKKKVGCSR
jgi:hypothetical protein